MLIAERYFVLSESQVEAVDGRVIIIWSRRSASSGSRSRNSIPHSA